MKAVIEEFVSIWTSQAQERDAKQYPNITSHPFEIRWGKKCAKVVREGAARAFIDVATGDIYMAASWAAPAKHVRGNVLSATKGTEAVSATGHVHYLR